MVYPLESDEFNFGQLALVISEIASNKELTLSPLTKDCKKIGRQLLDKNFEAANFKYFFL